MADMERYLLDDPFCSFFLASRILILFRMATDSLSAYLRCTYSAKGGIAEGELFLLHPRGERQTLSKGGSGFRKK